jgi:DNA-binding NarL/FixJ family response regulator
LVTTIRVVLVELQGIERDIVRHALRREDGISVVGDVRDRTDLAETLSSTRPDLVAAHPGLKILALERRGNGTLWQLRPHQTRLGELSPSLLLRAVEDAFSGS